MTNDGPKKQKRNVMQITKTDEFQSQVSALRESIGLPKDSAVIYYAVKETYDRRFGQKTG